MWDGELNSGFNILKNPYHKIYEEKSRFITFCKLCSSHLLYDQIANLSNSIPVLTRYPSPTPKKKKK